MLDDECVKFHFYISQFTCAFLITRLTRNDCSSTRRREVTSVHRLTRIITICAESVIIWRCVPPSQSPCYLPFFFILSIHRTNGFRDEEKNTALFITSARCRASCKPHRKTRHRQVRVETRISNFIETLPRR